MIEDKRKSDRQRQFLRGFIRTPENDSDIDCIVRDISETGAKLRFRTKPSITGCLQLHIPAKGQVVQSQLVWINNCEVGVSFHSIVAFGPQPSSDGARMARLETEITELKQMLKRLQKQIDKTEAA